MSAAPVRCWVCGYRGRRLPKGEPVPVIGRARKVQPHGRCPRERHGWPCDGMLLTIEDARYVLEAAIEHDNRGGNSRSEYDI
jgi:hypothetical protein